MFNWIKKIYVKFENWVHSWMPGFKTYLTLLFGFIGSTAAAVQSYITQLPLEKFATATQIAIFGLAVSLLALWFHGMSDRVDARSE